MGRTAIILVMGLGFAFGIISYNLNKNNTNAIETQMGYFSYMVARNLARTAIHTTLRKYDRGETVDEDGETIAYNDGTCDISVTTSGDTMWMQTIGHYNNEDYTIRLKLLRGTKPFPSVTGAVGFRATNVDFKVSGNPLIDGSNYDDEGDSKTGSGNMPGITTMNPADSSNVKSIGGPKIQGTPPVKVDTNVANPLTFVDEYRSNADYYYGPGTYSSVTWGSSESPVIVVCESPDTIVTVKFTGNVEGWGVLVVRGNLTVTGNFKFHGLVIVYGENNIVNAQAAMGTPEIIGGLILAGAAHTGLELKGTSNLKYSSGALEKAKNIGKLRFYSILDWYE